MPDPEKSGEKPDQASTPDQTAAQETAVDELSPEVRQMAEGCFDRAEQAVVRGNFDYAITLYLEGLRYNPREIERGHRGLRDAALKRRAAGKGAGLGGLIGQAKGAFSQMLGRHKDAMLALEAALTQAPQNVMILSQIMQLSRRLEYPEVAIWFGELAGEETLRTKKPQKQVFTTLADLYEAAGRYKDAVTVLNQAIKIDPSDRTLDKRARDLAARGSIQEGQLESVSDFHEMILDRRTAAASATQQVVRTEEQLEAQYEELKAALDADPENPVKMQALADCQGRRGNMDEAMSLLKKALGASGEYRYKARMDDLRMADYRRSLRGLTDQLEAEPDRADLKAKHKEAIAVRDKFELEVFVERQKQYPTDMSIRFELALRQYRNGLHDDAIVSFQQATRDPKRRIQAFNWLGKCFFAKKLYQEAQSQFQSATEQYELSSDPLGKELRYNLAMTLEVLTNLPEAIEWYSAIVQQDYQYRDAAKRLEALRRKVDQNKGQP